MDLPKPETIPPTAENVALAQNIARAHYGVPLPDELPRHKGFVVLVDDDLSLDEQLRVAREVANIRSVQALHSLMYVTRETYDPLGPRLLNGTTGETALPPWGLGFRER